MIGRFTMNKFEGSIVIYKSGNFIQKRMAYRIACAIKEATGADVTFGKVQTARKPVRLVTKDDKSLKNGDWKISIVGKTATFAAGSYYGYGGIAAFLATDAAKDFYAFEDGYVKTGNYVEFIDTASLFGSDVYAYNKRGEVRVMFNNVLFGDRSGMRKDENGKAIKDVPADKRNELQYELYKQYMPDVLGCQEFNITKRGERDIPHSDLVAMIKTLGYKESCPRDTKVHPFFNNTPLFYNTKTTKLIKSEYYWYKVHVDKENENNCSPMDCASKALTWGVFEDKATGKRYIVVSTHMATRSDGVRGVQALEAVEVIRGLVEKYQAPVFFGGDYNGLCQHANYVCFKAAGYEDLALSGAPTEFCSEVATHHTYPCFNFDLGFMLPMPDDSTHFAKNCIDHIMLINGENVKTSVYGVVVDECSMSASDHYPIFVDVNL